MALFGGGFLAPRLQPIVFSVVTVLLVYAVTRRWFGPRVAGIAVLLLAVQPSFVWFSRQGISVTSVMTIFSWGSLFIFGDKSGKMLADRPLRWGMAGICLGLGLWAKLPFLWWLMMLAAMAVLRIVFELKRGQPARRAWPTARQLVALAAGLALGAAPLIYFNVVGLLRDGQAHTVALILGSLLRPTQQFGVDNRDFLNNLATSWSNFKVFIDGSYFWYNGVTYSNTLALPALLFALIIGAICAFGRAALRPFRLRWLAFVLALPVAVFMGSFTVSGQWATHFFIISGLPQTLVACAAVWLSDAIVSRAGFVHDRRRGPIATAVALLLIAAPVARDVWVNAQHHNTLSQTGGSGRFSDAVYRVAAHLDETRTQRPVALDWGIEKQIRVLTADRVQPLEVFGYTPEPDDAFRQRVRALLEDPNRRYIVLWDRFAVYNRRPEFTRIANEMGKTVSETFIAHERSGLPVYVVLEAR
jgi:hypothetical protein